MAKLMIFVTVGTHEQQFNRLVEKVDWLKGKGMIEDEVIMQTGYCSYEPLHCKWGSMLSYHEMNRCIRAARIVITHGGPASLFAPLQFGKNPVVVPRQKCFGEHVNDHQLEFCRKVRERWGSIIVVEETEELEKVIGEYEKLCSIMGNNTFHHNLEFNRQFELIVERLEHD